MASVSELKNRTELTVNCVLDDLVFLNYTNELLEELSEITKKPANPIIFNPINDTEYVILKDDMGEYIRKQDGEYYNVETNEKETVNESDILYDLKITNNSIVLPDNWQETYKVEGQRERDKFVIRKRGFGDDEITTDYDSPELRNNNISPHLYFEKETSIGRKIVIKSPYLKTNSNFEITIYYYESLPLYEVDNEDLNFNQLRVPFESRYHNLVVYHNAMKYYQNLNHNDKILLYKELYMSLREEYRDAVQRKQHENISSTIIQEEYVI